MKITHLPASAVRCERGHPAIAVKRVVRYDGTVYLLCKTCLNLRRKEQRERKA